jgi:hypothetical protein
LAIWKISNEEGAVSCDKYITCFSQFHFHAPCSQHAQIPNPEHIPVLSSLGNIG